MRTRKHHDVRDARTICWSLKCTKRVPGRVPSVGNRQWLLAAHRTIGLTRAVDSSIAQGHSPELTSTVEEREDHQGPTRTHEMM